MTVTGVRKEKGHLCRIFFSDFEDVLLDLDVCMSAGVKKGTVIDEEKLEELKETSDFERAKSRALWYLDRTSHTEKGLYDKLVKAGFEKIACAKAIARLKELGLLDDVKYAENYSERLFESNASKKQIYYKLCEKGINRELAKETVAGLPDDEIRQIKNLIEKKYKTKLSDKENIKKIYASLVRKGFSFGDIKTALKQYDDETAFFDGD